MLRRSLAQIGGPYAITFWAWLVTLPLTVLISSVYATRPSAREVLAWTTALVVIHVVIGLLMLLARLTVLPGHLRRSRPITAVTVFAFLGLARAVLLATAQEWTGLGAFDPSERIAFNMVASVVLFSAIAIVIDEYRTDSAIVERLESAQQSLTALRTHEVASLADLDRRLLHEVQRDIEHRLTEQDMDAEQLRHLSESVVRSMSHELTRPTMVADVVDTSGARTSVWRTASQVMGRMAFPSAVAVVGTYVLLVFGVVAARYGFMIGVINAVVSSLASLVGLAALRRWMPLPRGGLLRVIVITSSTAAVGGIAAVVNGWEMSLLVDDFPVSVPAVSAGLVGLTLVISAWVAAAQGRAERQEAMSTAVEEEALEVARIQDLLNERRLAAGRFLHGTVQNELIAASMRGDSAEAVQSAIQRAFASYGDKPRTPTRGTLEGLLRSWSTVLDITSHIDERAWAAIDADPARGQLLVDLVSEGLTNAVRHTRGRSIVVEVTEDEGDLSVRVVTEGALQVAGDPGIGLKDLRNRGADVQLLTDGGTTVLAGHLN